MSYEVSVVRCDSYASATIRAAVEDCLRPAAGLRGVVGKGSRVLIKPNLLAAKRPEQAVTTHPALVEAVVRMVQEAGGVPVVGDSPGGRSTATSYASLLEKTGMRAMAEETGCELVSFDDAVSVAPAGARTFRKLKIAREVLDADAVIALPKLKTHQLTYYTGAVKLLYGYVPGATKTEYHLHTGRDVDLFAELLMDIHAARVPDLAIMDGVVGMEGRGPSSGRPRQIGLLLASRSCTALDFVACSALGMEPLSVPTVKKAHERGLGPGSLEEIAVRGVSLDAVRLRDFARAETMDMSRMPPALMGLASRIGGSRPKINAGRCRRCGICARDCPAKAISFCEAMAPEIDYKACIRCYCCQEICPHGAVDVHTPLLRRLIK